MWYKKVRLTHGDSWKLGLMLSFCFTNTEVYELTILLLMEEFLHHLGYINLVNSGINYQPQLVQDLFHQQYGWYQPWSFFLWGAPSGAMRACDSPILESQAQILYERALAGRKVLRGEIFRLLCGCLKLRPKGSFPQDTWTMKYLCIFSGGEGQNCSQSCK